MDGLDVIKEYLVSIGVAVNSNQFQQANSFISGQVAGMAKNVVKAGSIITAAFATVISGTAALIASTAKAEIGYQKFGTQMWMNADAAKSFKISLDAMGESMEDIAWNPELREQFMELHSLIKQMTLPSDFKDQMKSVRELMFGFKQLKVEITYAAQWISYYLTKYLDGPLKLIKQTFDGLNLKIVDNMPVWTKKVASFLESVVNIGASAVKLVIDLFKWLRELWDSFPPGIKKIVAALGVLGAVLVSGPISQIAALITGILILVEDFYGYIEGKESSKTLAPIWKEFVKYLGMIDYFSKKVSEGVKELWAIFNKTETESAGLKKVVGWWELLKSIIASIWDLLTWIGSGFKDFFDGLINSGGAKRVGELFDEIGKAVDSVSLGISSIINHIRKFFNMDAESTGTKQFWEWWKNIIIDIINLVLSLGKNFAGLFNDIGLLMQGKFSEAIKQNLARTKEAGKELMQILTGEYRNGSGDKPKPGGNPGSRNYGFDSANASSRVQNQTNVNDNSVVNVNVNVTNSNAAPNDIASAAARGVTQARSQTGGVGGNPRDFKGGRN